MSSRSEELYSRAVELLPGGVNSPVRAMRSIGRDPLFVARGEGAELIDVDGRRYADWVMSGGPLIAGHAHPEHPPRPRSTSPKRWSSACRRRRWCG